MKIYITDIASTLVQLGVPFEAQARYLQVAVARVIGYKLPLPAEPVEVPSAYFQEHLAGQAGPALDHLNERIPLDYSATLDLIQKIWEMRYGLVHPQTDAQAWTLLDACAKKAHLADDVDFNDPTLQRLSSVLSEGLGA